MPVNYSEALPPGVNPAGTLGLTTTFDLSAGDAAYVSATFEIPAPAPAALIAVAGLVGSRRRRRG